MLKGAIESLSATSSVTHEEVETVFDLVLKPTINAMDEMIYKEEDILFPMSMDKLTDLEWYEIYNQSDEIGYCLYDPREKWQPEGVEAFVKSNEVNGKIQLPTGNFSLNEILAIFKTLPVDITFVDKDDKVRYFSDSKERIFLRTKSVIGIEVQNCHPPQSLDAVENILKSFKEGKRDSVDFWIKLGEKFVYIRYFAVRDENGAYQGTLEVSQDVTEIRKLEGEKRLDSETN